MSNTMKVVILYVSFALVIIAMTFASNGCRHMQIKPQGETVLTNAEAGVPLVIQTPRLSWDNQTREVWSKVLLDAIDIHWSNLSQVSDMQRVCPEFPILLTSQKRQAWAETMIAISFFESGWNPATRYFETTMGYFSEGLFQLSVVDEQWAKCGLNETSILEPQTNIECAVKIMAGQIRRTKKLILEKGVYWAVIRDNGRFQKIDQIKTRVIRAMPLCDPEVSRL